MSLNVHVAATAHCMNGDTWRIMKTCAGLYPFPFDFVTPRRGLPSSRRLCREKAFPSSPLDFQQWHEQLHDEFPACDCAGGIFRIKKLWIEAMNSCCDPILSKVLLKASRLHFLFSKWHTMAMAHVSSTCGAGKECTVQCQSLRTQVKHHSHWLLGSFLWRHLLGKSLHREDFSMWVSYYSVLRNQFMIWCKDQGLLNLSFLCTSLVLTEAQQVQFQLQNHNAVPFSHFQPDPCPVRLAPKSRSIWGDICGKRMERMQREAWLYLQTHIDTVCRVC